ncbi:hypothetical protein KIW84_074987 [Lathyrus oleraceus]|uniref:DUF7745 domain-containing protein n=1 Tax=Pisum sativum TaxID=3888 RepID=A0A9D4VSL9_PEA|nr:hypothetical protein KIW84_074987 [Pisum sativum]
MPTLEEYAHLLGMHVSNKVPFSGLKKIPRSHIIAEALHLKKSEIEAHWMKKGGMFGLTSEFLIGKAIVFAQAGSMDVFEAIFVFLIYGLTLFPNIYDFVDVNVIRSFLIGNHVPTLLGGMYLSLHLRNYKGGGTIRLMPLTNDDISWYDSALGSLDIIDSCGEFSNVPLIGTQGGTNYNPALARRQLGFPLRDKPNNTQLESLFYQEGKDPQNLKQKMIHAWHNVHRKEDSFEVEDVIVDQLVLEKAQMEISFETEIRRIRRKFSSARLSYRLFFCASAKLTHQYNTRANQPKIMEHLEQENREMKDEIARLTAMMESVLAAQNQPSPTLATPP